jgi:hypothetical protein
MMEAELLTLQAKNLEKAEFDKQKAVIADRFSEKIDQRIEELDLIWIRLFKSR